MTYFVEPVLTLAAAELVAGECGEIAIDRVGN